ncbi:hypothetical protein [Paenibacillus sp. Marseille-Q7038]
MSHQGFTNCLQMFPSTDMDKTAAFYVSIGFREVRYFDSEEPHICLYKDRLEIVFREVD